MTDQQSKRQRLSESTSKRDVNEANVACETEPKSITNIYYDCLERIFDFLDLESLLNVAGTCKRLQIAAAAYFGEKFVETRVSIYGFERNSSWEGHAPKYTEDDNSIEVYAVNLGFPFLRCFGAKISNLRTDYNSAEDKRNDYLERYINQYCADTLKTCIFWYRKAFSIKNFIKPFEKVTTVDLLGFNMENQLPNLVRWFPNLRHLKMDGYIIIVGSALAVHFPHLEHLTLWLVEYDDAGYLTSKNAVKLLRANPQLQSLKIHRSLEFTLNDLMNTISGNTNISKLECALTDLNEIDLDRFVAEHSTIVELTAHCMFTTDQANILIRQLNSLKYFKFQVKDQAECQRLLSQLDEKWITETHIHSDNIFITLKKQD